MYVFIVAACAAVALVALWNVAMAKPKLALSCQPAAESFPAGGPILVRLTLRNQSGEALEIPAVGLPWRSFYAATFSVTDRRDVIRILPEGVPPELPPETVGVNAEISGEVDLGRYLQLADKRSIADVPGSYLVEAKVLTMAKPVGAAKLADMTLRCGPFTVTVV